MDKVQNNECSETVIAIVSEKLVEFALHFFSNYATRLVLESFDWAGLRTFLLIFISFLRGSFTSMFIYLRYKCKTVKLINSIY